MPQTFAQRLKGAWNLFRNRDQTKENAENVGPGYSIRADKMRLRLGTERSMIAGIYTRMAIDVAAIPIRHVRLDDKDRFVDTIDSGLNNCLTLSANIDQTSRAFIQDVVMSLFDEGCVAIVPVDTTQDISTGAFDVLTMRTARIVQWFPFHVRLEIYNDQTGMKTWITLPKSQVAIIENPLYSVMNEPNSTLKRLINKLNLLDAIDEQSSSGKLDLIIQLPYVVKTPVRKAQADARRAEIESQLTGSKYGIAYTDGTEKITQLNRPATNNLMDQITYLTTMLYNQLGLAESIFDGTADDKTINNYHKRTIEPILSAITDGIKRTFLTKTGRSQGQSIMFFKDIFSTVPVTGLSTIIESLSRYAVLSSNEVRAIIGYKASDEPGADLLSNKNLKAGGTLASPLGIPPTPSVDSEQVPSDTTGLQGVTGQ